MVASFLILITTETVADQESKNALDQDRMIAVATEDKEFPS